MRVRDIEMKEGDLITLDGSTGEVMQGAVPTVQPELSGDFATIMEWADKFRTMGVRVNCDTPQEAKVARSEEHTSELQSLMRISYAVFCLKKKTSTPLRKNIYV